MGEAAGAWTILVDYQTTRLGGYMGSTPGPPGDLEFSRLYHRVVVLNIFLYVRRGEETVKNF